MNIFGKNNTPEEVTDDKRMLQIIQNTLKNRNSTTPTSRLRGLCRVSFVQTYKAEFKGDFESLWKKAKGPT
jgi:hypothetical protein